MKKFLPLLILTCLVSRQAWSQKNGSLHFSFGGALPVGAFASKDANNPASGLANLGALAELGYSHPLKDSLWGLTIGLRGRMNSIDKNANNSVLQEAFPVYSWSASNSHWKALSAMAGIYNIIPAGSRLDVRTELSLGVASCYLPELSVTGVLDTAHTGATSYIQAKVNKANTTTFSASFKAGIAYHLNKRLQLLANLDFWYLNCNFKQVTQTVLIANQLVVPGLLQPGNASSISVNSQTQDYKQHMNTLNLTVGLEVSL